MLYILHLFENHVMVNLKRQFQIHSYSMNTRHVRTHCIFGLMASLNFIALVAIYVSLLVRFGEYMTNKIVIHYITQN